MAERQRDFQFKLTELEEEIESIDKHIELLERLDDPSDDEIRECISLTKEKLKLQKDIHQARVDNYMGSSLQKYSRTLMSQRLKKPTAQT